MSTAVLIGRDPLLPQHLGSDTRALLVSQDRRHLFVTPPPPGLYHLFVSLSSIVSKERQGNRPLYYWNELRVRNIRQTHLGICCARRRIILFIKYQGICHFVRLAPPPPLCRKRVCPPPFGTKGGATFSCGWGRGDPNRTTGEKAWRLYALLL